jgi:hypothetical protein
MLRHILRTNLRSLTTLALLLSGCDGPRGQFAPRVALDDDSVARARQDSINRAEPGYVIDSLLPIEEELRRFRAAIGGVATSALSGGMPTMDSLLEGFVRAVERADTTALGRLSVSAREFADLVYPESRYTSPPYRQSPGFLWSQVVLRSDVGLKRLLDRLGGRRVRMVGYDCDSLGVMEGRNRYWTNCAVRLRTDSAGTTRLRLFGTIIERDGAFKFMSYANGY